MSADTTRNGIPEMQPQLPEAVIRAHARDENAKDFHVLFLRYESKAERAHGMSMTMFITGMNCAVRTICDEKAYIIPSRNE